MADPGAAAGVGNAIAMNPSMMVRPLTSIVAFCGCQLGSCMYALVLLEHSYMPSKHGRMGRSWSPAQPAPKSKRTPQPILNPVQRSDTRYCRRKFQNGRRAEIPCVRQSILLTSRLARPQVKRASGSLERKKKPREAAGFPYVNAYMVPACTRSATDELDESGDLGR